MRALYQFIRTRYVSKQFATYFFVAGFAATIDLSTLYALLQTTSWHYTLAVSGGFITGTITNFLLSNLLIFSRKSSFGATFVKHFASSAVGFLANLGTVVICVELFLFPVMISKIIALGFSFMINFLLIKFYAFGDMKV